MNPSLTPQPIPALPWSRGFTLLTPQTERWTSEQMDANNLREGKRIFAHFSIADQGRGRVFIGEFQRPEWAEHVVKCVNAHEDLAATTALLRVLLDQVDYTAGACGMTEMVGACLDPKVIKQCREALAKVKP